MSAIIHGHYAGCVVLEDDRGLGMIPTRAVRDMHYRAVQRDAATASWGGRRYDRDTLNAAHDAIDTLALPELPSCWLCVDGPAVDRDLKDRDVCLRHLPDDSGDHS